MLQPKKYKNCTNCGDKITKTFCPSCGQKNTVGRLTWATLGDSLLATFIGEGAIGETNRTARYGFLMTLRAIIMRPGQTVDEYLDGQRRKYFNPVTILLLLSGFYALVGTFFGIVEEVARPSNIAIIHDINAILTYGNSHPATFTFALLPLSALAMRWIFRHTRRLRYVEYAYLVIFIGIFSMIINLLRLPFETTVLKSYDNYATIASFALRCWFSAMVFRHLFGISTRRAIWCWAKATIISYSLLIVICIVVPSIVLGVYYLIDSESLMQFLKQTLTSIPSTSKR